MEKPINDQSSDFLGISGNMGDGHSQDGIMTAPRVWVGETKTSCPPIWYYKSQYGWDVARKCINRGEVFVPFHTGDGFGGPDGIHLEDITTLATCKVVDW